jgi:hypothetical protein
MLVSEILPSVVRKQNEKQDSFFRFWNVKFPGNSRHFKFKKQHGEDPRLGTRQPFDPQ